MKLKRKMFLLFTLGLIVIGLMLFLPAGSFSYWQGWLFIAILFIPCLFVALYFLKHDPKLLERRMKFKEKEVQQRLIIKISILIFIIGFLIPGFDYRYHWSNVPVFLVIISAIIVLVGYSLVFFVFKENSFTSRTVEVYKKQKLVSTGPYAIIRHPMYLGVILMYLFMPLTLGSYYASIFSIPMIFVIIFRTLNEEKVLLRDLKGYKEYMKKVKYRIIPYLW
ncbi:MAG: isoprenylcysteine carboxylmethyltransferase family protein [Candidatus Nanoarchaeia archaeon]